MSILHLIVSNPLCNFVPKIICIYMVFMSQQNKVYQRSLTSTPVSASPYRITQNTVFLPFSQDRRFYLSINLSIHRSVPLSLLNGGIICITFSFLLFFNLTIHPSLVKQHININFNYVVVHYVFIIYLPSSLLMEKWVSLLL